MFKYEDFSSQVNRTKSLPLTIEVEKAMLVFEVYPKISLFLIELCAAVKGKLSRLGLPSYFGMVDLGCPRNTALPSVCR